MANIHTTAIIEQGAKIDQSAKIGAFCYIEADVVIGKNTNIMSHNYIFSGTTIGENNVVHPFCALGNIPQDLKYGGEKTALVIGNNNVIREHCLIHKSTNLNHPTTIGNDNLIMGDVHIAHDCQVGNQVIVAHSVKSAGHVTFEDNCIIGGATIFHQFCKVGKNAFIGGGSIINNNVPPFCLVMSDRISMSLMGANIVGLRRNNFSSDEINEIKDALTILFKKSQDNLPILEKAKQILDKYPSSPNIRYLYEFIIDNSPNSRGIKLSYER